MTAVALLLCLTAVQTPSKITIQPFQDDFVVRAGLKKFIVPMRLDRPKPPMAVVFRKNKNFAVWDERGLSLRFGKKLVSYKLKEVAVSPRVFDRDEIRANLELFKQGKRSQEADALSGAKRIGNEAYFLVRWDDAAGTPWLEALVKVDLSDAKPEWKLLGKFEGISLARAAIDDRLMLHNGFLAVIASKDKEWGESFYSSGLKAFGFKKMGTGLANFTEQRTFAGLFVEKTAYGTLVGGAIDLETGKRKEVMEVKGTLKFIDGDLPFLAVVGDVSGAHLRNADSGAEIVLPASSAVRRTGAGVVVWSPIVKPSRAWLYDPVRWSVLATWDQAARGASAGAGNAGL